MGHAQLHKIQFSTRIVAICRWISFACLASFVTYVALRGISESWDNENFPEALAIKLELLPFLFPIHMVTGGLALLLVPLTIYLRHTKWHKILGRISAIDIAIAGLTAFPVAIGYPITVMSSAGFAAQALIWLVLLSLGLWHIRNGRTKLHQNNMILMAAVTSGAMFFRVYLGLWNLLGPHKFFYTFYAIDAWIAWGIPLLVTWLYLQKTRSSK
jgi:hypothetical protein